MLLLIAYLVAAVTVFNDKPAHQVCRDMELVIKDTLNAGFVTKNEVAAILQKKGIYPVGKKMDRVHTKTLEKELDKHPLINEAQCYKTPNGKICVEVTQRVPILHIMSSNGENYYWITKENDAARCKMRSTPGNCHRKCRKVVCNEGFI